MTDGYVLMLATVLALIAVVSFALVCQRNKERQESSRAGHLQPSVRSFGSTAPSRRS